MSAERGVLYRKWLDRMMLGMTTLCALIAIAVLLLILGYIAIRGASVLNWNLLTQLPKPIGETGGGIGNAIAGTLILIGLACLVGLPVGIFSGIYLAEFGHGRFGSTLRFLTDVLTGVPSIVIGIFAYTLLVLPMRRFSALAGGFALGVIMIPVVTRTTEEMMKLVPSTLREAALALGAPEWRAILGVVVRSAGTGIATGVMLAIARIAGETAPLLFTALGSRFWPRAIDEPAPALTLQIFNYATGPYEEWHRLAWAGTFVLVALILIINISVRWLTRNPYRTGH
ncbi:MAG: phosphate ABC transporter permease PstA [Acidobacteria bacterium]|nr:phosphate ABC transporter permease PstA [Acidobacteriota bacterium]MBI3655010.1 phosphate ABC transporter permease PstA [Acidobacteriota bacterium]